MRSDSRIENIARQATALGHELWAVSRPLTGVGLAMITLLGGTVIGLAVDPRVITGAPAWLKPAKFAISIAVYCLTFAWVLRYLLPTRPRLVRWTGHTIAWSLALEFAIIALQAARGTTSHFNVSTPFDAAMFSTMGAAIAVLWFASLTVAVALFRTRFADRALGWALRLGVALSVMGAAFGGFMTRPTEAQLEEARASGEIRYAGAHTVGALDGGSGLPITGWSTRHGDLRVAHFFGLHAVQLLPTLAWLIGRSRRLSREGPRVAMVGVAAASYAGLVVLLLWQALRGQSVIAPDAVTLAALAAWLGATLAGVAVVYALAARSIRGRVSRVGHTAQVSTLLR